MTSKEQIRILTDISGKLTMLIESVKTLNQSIRDMSHENQQHFRGIMENIQSASDILSEKVTNIDSRVENLPDINPFLTLNEV